jgi:hypothetical protein
VSKEEGRRERERERRERERERSFIDNQEETGRRERERGSFLGVRARVGERFVGTTTQERVVAGAPGESVRGEKCTKRRTQSYAFTCHMLKMCYAQREESVLFVGTHSVTSTPQWRCIERTYYKSATVIVIVTVTPGCCWLLMQYLIQSCARGGRRTVEDMCYEIRRAETCVD